MEDASKEESRGFALRGIKGLVTRGKSFLTWVKEVMQFEWLACKSPEEKKGLLHDLLASLTIECAKKNHLLSLLQLLEWVDVDYADYNETTSLHAATRNGHSDIIKFLLARSADINQTDRFGATPLQYAINTRNNTNVRILRLNGGVLSIHPVRIGLELCSLVANRDFKALESWHLAGVNFDQSDYNGTTPLHVAVHNGDLMMVEKLLAYGATPLTLDIWGRTPMDIASNVGHKDIAEVLKV